jgi:hypothetical protein
MEGDVSSILARPTIPTISPDDNQNPPINARSSSSNNVHRYASRDLRVKEAEAEIEKWDAWHACAGMSRTEAKRKYISTLIETMKEYASGTQESRELVSELEFVWNQIRSQSGSSDDDNDNDHGQESPTRRLERAGLKQMTSFGSTPPDEPQRTGSSSLGMGGSRRGILSRTNTDTNPNRLRVLSPVSQQDSDDVVEGEEIDPDAAAIISHSPEDNPSISISNTEWRTRIESHLRHLSTEIAALREQLSSNHLLFSSSFSPSLTSRRRRILYRIYIWIRWLAWAFVRQVFINATVIFIMILYARWKGQRDRKVEHWARRRWEDAKFIAENVNGWLRGTLSMVKLTGLSRIS